MDKQEKPDRSLLEEVVDNIIIRVDQMENREVKIPDYRPQFEALENLIKSSLQNNNHHIHHDDFTKFIEQQQIVSGQMQAQIGEVKTIVSTLPKSVPIKHSLDIKAKGITIALASVFVVLALLFGYCLHLHSANERLEANDIKYRAIRQTAPQWTHWADTTYERNPGAMVTNTERLEDEAIEKTEAERIAEQKENEAKNARKHLTELKKKR